MRFWIPDNFSSLFRRAKSVIALSHNIFGQDMLFFVGHITYYFTSAILSLLIFAIELAVLHPVKFQREVRVYESIYKERL